MEQIEYDASFKMGLIGHRMPRPSCNENGLYSPIKCIPGQMLLNIFRNIILLILIAMCIFSVAIALTRMEKGYLAKMSNRRSPKSP